jgi:SAM-dependent methyltransferase
MANTPFDDYQKEILFQREVWRKKPALRDQYHFWYKQIVAELSPHRAVIEIGSRSGNFKEYFPEVISTDVFKSGEWIDRVMDPQNLALVPNEVGNIVAIDVVHHLQRPLSFLRQASVSLKPGGRLILCEPAVTPWSRLVYGRHHEPLDTQWDLFGVDGLPPEADPGHTFANIAIPHILFSEYPDATLKLVPNLKLIKRRYFSFLLYPLTGGFGYRSFVPNFGFKALLKIEDVLTRPFASWLTGLRMLVVLEKQ